MKKNWKAIVAVLALALMVGGIAFYVHGVYLPARQAQKADELRGDAREAAIIEQTSYDYTIKVEPNTKADNKDSGVTVTTDKDGDVWISRDWTGDTSGYEHTDSPDEISESGAVANIGSGAGDNIVDEDGVYHGEQEQPENTAKVANSPLPVMTVGPTPTSPPAIESVKPAPTQVTPSPAPEATPAPAKKPVESKPADSVPPVATSTPVATFEPSALPVQTVRPTPTPPPTVEPKASQQPTSGGNGGNAKAGDTRTVDGQQQIWVNGWGWIPVGSGNTQEYVDVDTTGEYVGEFG